MTPREDLLSPPADLVAHDVNAPVDDLATTIEDLPVVSLDLTSPFDAGLPPSFVHKPYAPGMSSSWADVRAIHGNMGTVYATGTLGSFSTQTHGASYLPFPHSFFETIHTVWSSPSRVVFGGYRGLCIVPVTGGDCTRFGDEESADYEIFGLAAVANDVYAVGTKGALAISHNGGESFAWAQAPGSVDAFYRSVYADSNVVLIGHAANAGSLARSTRGSTGRRSRLRPMKSHRCGALGPVTFGPSAVTIGVVIPSAMRASSTRTTMG